jgi:hypothetical protein
MSVFNRIVMTLLFAGLFVLGVYTVVYSFDLFGRSLTSLPISDFSSGLQDFVGRVEDGNLSVVTIVTLALLAILGLIWFIAELRPSTPRRVRMGNGTYVSRSVVGEEVSTAAEQVPDVLGTSVGVKARRSPGGRVDLEARVTIVRTERLPSSTRPTKSCRPPEKSEMGSEVRLRPNRSKL